MPGLLPVALLGLVLVDMELLAPQVLEDLDLRASLAEVKAPVVGEEADRKLDRVSDLASEAVDDELLTLSHPVLLSTALYDREHVVAPRTFQRLRQTYRTCSTRQ